MSHPNNTEWLETAKENFDTCIEQGDYHGVLKVIADVRTMGFLAESITLQEMLREIPLEKFVTKSPYDL